MMRYGQFFDNEKDARELQDHLIMQLYSVTIEQERDGWMVRWDIPREVK